MSKKNKSAISHATYSAMVCFLLAALWNVIYLVSTEYKFGAYGGPSLLEYMLGSAHGLGSDAVEGLFVIVTRFLIVFGLGWYPLTLLSLRSSKKAE